MMTDFMNASNDVALVLLALSSGYFIYDSIDMVLNNPKASTYKLLMHHLCGVVCFGLRWDFAKLIYSIAWFTENRDVFLLILQIISRIICLETSVEQFLTDPLS
jgi:hypothetical protein